MFDVEEDDEEEDDDDDDDDDEEEFPVVASTMEFCELADEDDGGVEEEADDAEDEELPLLPSWLAPLPLSSFDLTISCFASLVFVPGFVLLIFILRPLSTVAECSTAILPGLPAFVCTALTAPGCCFPVEPPTTPFDG